MRYSEFLKSIQSGNIQPVVTFLGEEVFLKQRALDAVLNRFLDPESRSFQFRSIAAEEIKDASFLDDAGTVPMFGDWKVLYIKNAGTLDKSLTRIKDYLEEYLDRPAQNTILIFDVDGWEGRSKLKAILNKKTTIVEFQPLSEKEIPSWVSSHLRTLKFQIDPGAVQMLTERLGTDLQKISSELEKLMLFRQAEKRITSEDVENTVGFSATATVWNFINVLLDQDAGQAIHLLDQLLDKGEEPVYCVAMLAKQFEKMILTKEMVKQKVPQASIAQKINKPIYYLQAYLNQLARYTMQDLVKAIRILSYADRALKSSQASERTILHLMTVELCHLKAAAPPVFEVPLV